MVNVVNIPETDKERIVIIGGGFAGLTLAKNLVGKGFQIVLLDKNNFHSFQPLFYQVAMSGLEPSSISFPLRKIFQKRSDIHIRLAEVLEINTDEKYILTEIGRCNYDKLVIAIGAKTNYFGNPNLEHNTLSLKSTGEAIYLRNEMLKDFESALITRDYDKRQEFLDTVVVGGGPTGVELAGAIAEMKQYIIPKDYPELNFNEVDVYLIHSGDRLLPSMSEKSGKAAEDFLRKLGVNILKNIRVSNVENNVVYLNDGKTIKAKKVLWAAGITGNTIKGLEKVNLGYGNRLIVDRNNKVKGLIDVYAIGDIALMETDKYPQGHPQVAQVAIQQAKNLTKVLSGKNTVPFEYNDKGSMATIGRNKAVVDLTFAHFHGFFAWVLWLVVHLMSLIGTRNKVMVFLNWLWNYVTYDQSLRLILRAGKDNK
jgi:NADH dehydrogenase